MFEALSQFVFGASNLFSSQNQPEFKSNLWKDKKLGFDVRLSELELGFSEELIGCFYPIEDVKGNQDRLGMLMITNLRLIWICVEKRRVNLSIGWDTVTLIYEQNLKDLLCDRSASLFVLSKHESTKYEFVFSEGQNVFDYANFMKDPSVPRKVDVLEKFMRARPNLVYKISRHVAPFEAVFKVWQAYKQTHLFRHCRSNIIIADDEDYFRKAILEGRNCEEYFYKSFKKLPLEEIRHWHWNVYHVISRTNKHKGSLTITNLRLVWFSDLDTVEVRSLSIPFLRITALKLKTNSCILVTTNDHLSNSTLVTLQVQYDADRVLADMRNRYSLSKISPRFGPESHDDCIHYMERMMSYDGIKMKELLGKWSDPMPASNVPETVGQAALENVEVGHQSEIKNESDDEVDQHEKDLDRYANNLVHYLNERSLELDNELIYSTDLGLAMEKPANGASVDSIWQIDV